ncbi:anti-anti-sigma factor [bacterium SCGC AG-212-C10]|nr:anti-anti-sigma factor [bacterium SCGC AG-212-C10]
MTKIPTIKIGDTLIATVHEDLTDRDALEFQEALNARLEREGATGLLIDVALVNMIDSFLGRLLHEIAQGARLLGASTVVAGIQPAVAITLVELGLQLPGVRTALTTERGLLLLAQDVAREKKANIVGQ